MQSELMMLAGFLILAGIAAGLYSILRVTAGEGMLLGVFAVTIIMYAGGKFRNFPAAVIVCGVLGAAGALAFLWQGLRQRKNFRGFFSLEMFFLTAIFLGSMFLFHGDFLQKIDDFHQWAAAVRYMLMKGRLPMPEDFLGAASMPMFTGTFHLFFQELGGYNEGHMYVSSFFLNAVAILLPLCRVPWRKWKSSFVYVFTVYVGLYTLYLHSYKSLYVDLPAAAWAMAFCIWFSQSIREIHRSCELRGFEAQSTRAKSAGRRSAARAKSAEAKATRVQNAGGKFVWRRSAARAKSAEAMVLLVGLPQVFMIAVIKQGIGILLLGFDLIYVAADLLFVFGWKEIKGWIAKRRTLVIAALAAALALAAAVLLLKGKDILPVSGGGIGEALLMRSEKARLTFRTLMNKIVTRVLCSHSRIKAKALPTTCIYSALLVLMAALRRGRERKRFIWLTVFNVLNFVLYLAALYIVYVSTFSYEESVSNAAVHRYLSVIILYQFFMVMAAAYGLLESAGNNAAAGRSPEAGAGAERDEITGTEGSPEASESRKRSESASAENSTSEEAVSGSVFRRPRFVRGMRIAICAGLCVTCAAGINKRMISDVSHYRFWKIAGYSVIKKTKNQLSDVGDYVPVNEKVYLLVQDQELGRLSEFPMCIPLYYRTDGISNYLKEPWKFNESGSLRLLSQTDIGIGSFPDMLSAGNYQYVWIYSVDNYLKQELPKVLSVEGEVTPGLYRCVRDPSGHVTGLQFVTELG